MHATVSSTLTLVNCEENNIILKTQKLKFTKTLDN